MCDQQTKPAKTKKHLKKVVKTLHREVDFLSERLDEERHENRQYRRTVAIAGRAALVGAGLLTARWVLGYGRY